MRKILIVDCFDSFTYNLFHKLEKLNSGSCDVVRYDDFRPSQAAPYSHVVLSPGPALPSDYPLIADYLSKKSPEQVLLGICLGHQCIAVHHGGRLLQLEKVRHGFSDEIVIVGNSKLFGGMKTGFAIGHYHSWVVEEKSLQDTGLVVTSRSPERFVMSFEHEALPHYGLQFHPESIMTPRGEKILQNWLET